MNKRTIAEDRTMFYLKAGFHMIADRRSQLGLRSSAILRLAIADDRRLLRSQIADRRSQTLLRTAFMETTSAIVCDPAIVIAITIAGSQTIADLIAICNLRSAIRDHMETSLKSIYQLISPLRLSEEKLLEKWRRPSRFLTKMKLLHSHELFLYYKTLFVLVLVPKSIKSFMYIF